MKKKMSSLLIILTTLTMLLSLSSCGNAGAEDPITKAAPGMTLREATEAEPALAEDDGKGYSCDKNYMDTEGKLLISFNSYEGEPTVMNILWQADPTDGSGKAVSDALLADLKKCYGKPDQSVDKKDVTSVTGVHDEANARWNSKEYTISVTYIEYKESGKCQIQYKRSAKNPL